MTLTVLSIVFVFLFFGGFAYFAENHGEIGGILYLLITGMLVAFVMIYFFFDPIP